VGEGEGRYGSKDCAEHVCPVVDGHSSSEDASACMHLVIWKIREDAKTKR
jgi:hypothetical protein